MNAKDLLFLCRGFAFRFLLYRNHPMAIVRIMPQVMMPNPKTDPAITYEKLPVTEVGLFSSTKSNKLSLVEVCGDSDGVDSV